MSAELGRRMAAMTRRSLLVGGAAALAGGAIWEWIRTRRLDNGVPWPLRSGLAVNEEFARDYFREARLVRTFHSEAVESGRPNGAISPRAVRDIEIGTQCPSCSWISKISAVMGVATDTRQRGGGPSRCRQIAGGIASPRRRRDRREFKILQSLRDWKFNSFRLWFFACTRLARSDTRIEIRCLFASGHQEQIQFAR